MDLQKLREMAGVDQHVKIETKLFDDVCAQLKKLKEFCGKQNEQTYSTIGDCAQSLCDKLGKHLDRYKK